MPRGSHWLKVKAALVLIGLLISACGSTAFESSEADQIGPTAYFAELAEAYSSNDFYGILDFYAADAFQERWRGAVRGGSLVRDLLRWNSGDLGHEIVDVHLGSTGALNLIRWEKGGGLTAIVSTLDGNRIAAETAFDHGAWLASGLRTSPEILAVYESLYASYADAWSEVDEDALREIYASHVTLKDTLRGAGASGLDALLESRPMPGSLDGLEVDQEVNGVPIEGLAVFLGPADFGVDPGRAVGLYTLTDADGCRRQIALAWEVAGGKIVEEERYEAPDGLQECQASQPVSGWWASLDLPVPSDLLATGVIRTPGGHELEIFNGTRRLEALLLAGLERFAEGGLAEPRFDSATFEPTRRCQNRSGRLLQDEAAREIFLCIYESDLCGTGLDCEVALQSVRLAVLHELAHAWIIDNVDSGTREEFLDAVGLSAWEGDAIPWARRGVEYAAEVVAWGLMEEDASMARIGRPSCESLHASYRVLTGVEPLRADGGCAG